MYSRHMAQYNVKVQVGSKVRHKRTGVVYTVVRVEPSPHRITGCVGALQNVFLTEPKGGRICVGAMEEALLGTLWERLA